MMMKCSFYFCCFELKFFLTFWSEFVTFHRDNCFAQCVAIVGSQPNFFRLLSKATYTPCRITTNHCHIVLMDIHLIFAIITIQYRPSFSQLQVWKHFFRWLDCRRLWLILDHWFITWLLNIVLNSWITLPWSRIWIYFTVESLGIKVIGLVLIYENCVMDLVILFFILALNYHLIITWRNFDCMVLRLWNTNTYNIHQMHRQVYKVW